MIPRIISYHYKVQAVISLELVVRERKYFTQDFINNSWYKTVNEGKAKTKRNKHKIVSRASRSPLHQQSYNQNHAEISFNLLLNRVSYFPVFKHSLFFPRYAFESFHSKRVRSFLPHILASVLFDRRVSETKFYCSAYWQKLLCELSPADYEDSKPPWNHFEGMKYWC